LGSGCAGWHWWRAAPVRGGVVGAGEHDPHLNATADNPVEQIRQLVQCGNTMYAVGSFPSILKGSTTYARSNVFSFSALAPFTVTSWAPNVNGTVNTIGI
jgi:hypothetical protein